MSDNLVGKSKVTCPTCGATVRADRLAKHATRCPAGAPRSSRAESASPAPRSPAPAKHGKQPPFVVCPLCGAKFLERHYQRHQDLCRTGGWNDKPSQEKAPSDTKRKERSVPHQDSDSEFEMRRTRLIYVSPKVGIIAQANKKRGRRTR